MIKLGFFLFALALIFNTSFSKEVGDLENTIDSLFADYEGNNPGASVIVIKKGGILLESSYGLADIENNIRTTPATNFRLASITKQFTAMSILQLIEKEKISLTTTINDIFPEFPDYGKKIKVLNLLNHSSGLIDYESLIPDSATRQVSDWDVFYMMIDQDSTYFEPGSLYRYSNTGYAVLAVIIEKVTGENFANYLHKHIFSPLKMNNSVAYEKGISEIHNRAYGYKIESGTAVFSDQSLTSAVLGDGGIYSSVRDLYLWDQALYGEVLVNKELMERMFSPSIKIDKSGLSYGFGWRLDEYKGYKRIHHGGSTSGFRNVIQRFPDKEITVIILTNRAEPDVTDLAVRISDLILKDSPD